MRSLSAEFRRKIYEDEADYQVRAVIYITSNLRLDLDNSNIWTGGFSFEECVSEDDNFTAIGSVIMGSATLIINNIYDTYSQYDFTNVKVELYIGMQLSNSLEELKIGTYIVDNAVYNGATITLTLVDYISKFDQSFYLTSLSYPATLLEIVQNLCTVCGVTLNTLNFPHNGYSINYEPEKEAVSCREVLSWVATIAGCYVKCNASGQLMLQWFNTTALENFASELDGGTFNPWSTGDVYDGGTLNPWSEGDVYDGGPIVVNNTVHYINDLYTQSIAMDDVVITGVSIEVKNTDDSQTQELLEFKTGTAGYVIQLSENPFINPQNAQTIINWLGTQLIGLRFRKLSVSIAGDLAIESGDVGVVTDARQSIYRILITRVTFSVGGVQSIICGASTPARNSAVRFSNNTKNYVELRKQLKQQKTTYDQALDDLADAMNAKSGLYSTIEVTQSGNIYYLHDKPTLADSKVVWKMNSEAIAVTTDYKGSNPSQTVWNFGVQINGDVVARILTARGVNADWINAGAISIKNANNVETFYANTATGVVRINATSFQLTDGTTISSAAQAAAAGAISGLTQQQVFDILTNNSLNEGIYLSNGRLYVNASMINTGYLSFNRAKGGTIKLGGENNGNGILQVYEYKNGDKLIAELNQDGLSITSDDYDKIRLFNTSTPKIGLIISYYGLRGGSGADDTEYTMLTLSDGLDVHAQRTKQIKLTTLGSDASAASYEQTPYGERDNYGGNFRHTFSGDANFRGDVQFGYTSNKTTINSGYITAVYVTSDNFYGHLIDPSDERLKNKHDWNDSLLAVLDELKPIVYNFKNSDDNKIHIGFGAQTTQNILDKNGLKNYAVVNYNEEKDIYGIAYTEIIPVLVSGYQRLKKENDELKRRLDSIEKRLDRLERNM